MIFNSLLLPDLLRKLPALCNFRGQTRITYLFDKILRRKQESIYSIGQVLFPFLSNEDQREMFYGLYEREIVIFMNFWLRNGDTFIDIGSNVGYLSAVAANNVGKTGQIYAFEPEPEHFARLKRFKEINKEFSIQINENAVSEVTGEISLYISPHAGWHTIIPGFNQKQYGVKEIIRVLATTLDNYIDRHIESDSIRLVKIDVEGAEANVIRGGKRLVKNRRVDAYLVEVTPFNESSSIENLQMMSDCFSKYRYKAYAFVREINWWNEVNIINLSKQTNIIWMKEELSFG